MRIGLLQLEPIIKDIQASMKRASLLLKDVQSLDLLLLPEMSFTGYVFKSKDEIGPFMEDENGPSVSWAKEQAKRLNAFVQVGYPRVQAQDYFNSVSLVDPEGKVVYTYDKHFLYSQDECWATAGEAFKSFDTTLGKVAPGICMDINPKGFVAPFHAYEFANFHVQSKSNLFLLSMAWLHPDQGPEFTQHGAERQMHSYWAQRLLPLIAEERKSLVYICNRVGEENGSRFGGASCVFEVSNGSFIELGSLPCLKEGFLQVET